MTAPREPPPHPAADEAAGGWPLVVALAAAQVVSWGSVYYSFSLLVVPMEQDLGWSRTALNGALSLGLLTAGICAYSVGAWIDRRGGRAIMTAGTILGAALLALWSQIETPAALYALWVGLGLSMAATLYEPVFVVLARRFPRSYRTRIAVVTFIAGFSSTVFVPLTQLLIDRVGWREALLALAAINLSVCLPIHALWLRDGPHPGAATATASDLGAESRDAVRRALRHPVFWALAASLTTYYATFSALTFHLIPLLAERRVPTAVAIGAVALIGPAQVAGRLVVFLLGSRLPTATTGRMVLLGLPLAVLLLIAFPHSTVMLFAAAVLYGGANGIMTIVRGTAVPDLMWREGYGAVNGALAAPAMAAMAGAPLGAALLWSAAGGYDAVLWMLFAVAAFAAVAFWIAAAAARRSARS
jgi:predicted MFS family arabinose efflux permease